MSGFGLKGGSARLGRGLLSVQDRPVEAAGVLTRCWVDERCGALVQHGSGAEHLADTKG